MFSILLSVKPLFALGWLSQGQKLPYAFCLGLFINLNFNYASFEWLKFYCSFFAYLKMDAKSYV